MEIERQATLARIKEPSVKRLLIQANEIMINSRVKIIYFPITCMLSQSNHQTILKLMLL